MDTAIGGVVWYLFGYAFAYGDSHSNGDYPGNGFIGTHYFATSGLDSSASPYDFRHWIFQWAFAITSSTIVSGAMAERTRLRAYFLFCVALAVWIYPVPTHWIWSRDGWLSPYNPDGKFLYANGFLDFAGDSVVHMIGGISGFVGAWIVGPRLGRFDPELKGHFDPHNQSFMMLGTMILWFGWYGFNPGSTQALANGQGLVAARISINTTLAASCGTIAGLFCAQMFLKQWHLPTALNGTLAGLVAITGGCAVLQPWAACIAGLTAAFVYFGSSWLMVNKMKVDDPLEATNVHFFCGAWGLILVGLFADRDHIEKSYSLKAGSVVDYGLFMGGGGKQLAMQLLGIVVIGAWTAFFAGAFWFLMKKLKIIRISDAAEKDLLSHAVELERIQKGTRALRAVAVGEGTEVRTMAPKTFTGANREAGKETVVVIQDSDSGEDADERTAGKRTNSAKLTTVAAKAAGANVTYISDSSASSSKSSSDGARRRFTTEGRKESNRDMPATTTVIVKDDGSTSSDESSSSSSSSAAPKAKKPATKKSAKKSSSKKSSHSSKKSSSSASAKKPAAANQTKNIAHIPASSDADTTDDE
eukprot:TRINITY_DN4154_c0_g1_i1.p1 TRINITY_DN4154_c0_g1~~TRINITY_DN4154_c0_g1_i1.p1  ORF type:complete len:587 (-),score=143.59 TRINITY_DN4154_c0_g1_i1:13-1773(-)